MAEEAAPLPKADTRLPAWAKILAGVSFFVIIWGAVFGCISIAGARKLCLDAVNPVFIEGTLKLIGDFPAGSLAGLRPELALRLPALSGYWKDFSGVQFGEDQNKLQFNLIAFQSEESDPDPADVLDFCYDNPLIFRTFSAKCMSISDKGKADINGHQLVYEMVELKNLGAAGKAQALTGTVGSAGSARVTGSASNGEGAPSAAAAGAENAPVYKGLIGCMTRGAKVIVMLVATPQDHKLDINMVSDLLRKARSF